MVVRKSVSFLFFLTVMPWMGAPFCLEYSEIWKLDCSGGNLDHIPYSKVMSWVWAADFSHNNFTVLNTTELLVLFPNLVRLDLRDNPLKCPPATVVEILSDGPPTISSVTFSPATISLPTAQINGSTEYSPITITAFPMANISTTATSGNGKSNLYLFIVIPVCTVVCIVLVCLLPACLTKRRRRPSNSIRMEKLFSIASSDIDSAFVTSAEGVPNTELLCPEKDGVAEDRSSKRDAGLFGCLFTDDVPTETAKTERDTVKDASYTKLPCPEKGGVAEDRSSKRDAELFSCLFTDDVPTETAKTERDTVQNVPNTELLCREKDRKTQSLLTRTPES
ncbi:Hypothetical predicted protein [Paramuricea clavata]|uniref:Uncharacterized protein n=1 Tax=Paramuricea clavata TaxID=317549 RepID=A0A7D9DGR9_PARCT|nr:Hypothetical predicted protein [Paramuricea clavata]